MSFVSLLFYFEYMSYSSELSLTVRLWLSPSPSGRLDHKGVMEESVYGLPKPTCASPPLLGPDLHGCNPLPCEYVVGRTHP